MDKVVEVNPTIRIPEQRARKQHVDDRNNFGQVVSWPIVQAIAVGLAAFGLAYLPLNYITYFQVWVPLSVSTNTQLAALIGGISGCASCIVFFMLEEVGWLFRYAGEWYGQVRNSLDTSGLESDIRSLMQLYQVAQDEIVDLKRQNAILLANSAKNTKGFDGERMVSAPTYQPISQRVTYEQDLDEYMAQHHADIEVDEAQQADDGTLNEMTQARKILMNAYKLGAISRGSCMANQRMSRTEWQTGIDFLKLNGAVGETPPRGHELLVDAKQALDLMNERMNYRAQHATGNFVPK